MKTRLVIAAFAMFLFTQCDNKHNENDGAESTTTTESRTETESVNQGEGGSGGSAGVGNDIDRQGQNGRTEGQKASDGINRAGNALDSTLNGR